MYIHLALELFVLLKVLLKVVLLNNFGTRVHLEWLVNSDLANLKMYYLFSESKFLTLKSAVTNFFIAFKVLSFNHSTVSSTNGECL